MIERLFDSHIYYVNVKNNASKSRCVFGFDCTGDHSSISGHCIHSDVKVNPPVPSLFRPVTVFTDALESDSKITERLLR